MTIQESPRSEEESPVTVVAPGTPPPPGPDGASGVAAEESRPVDKWIFGIGAVLVVAFIAWGVTSVSSLSSVSSTILGYVIDGGGWAFVLAASGFVIFALYVALSKYGRIPLARDGEAPEFRTVSWIAMMFSAGMGIGLMFWGAAEPLAFFVSPPPGTVAAGDPRAMEIAMATALFHWTLHPWAIYAVVGLAIAYSTFRKGRSQLISSAFAPLLGEMNTQGPLGKFIDILAIFATLFGSAASLGLGALQIGAGLELNGVSGVGRNMLVIIIAVLTLAFVVSAVSGVAKGIQWLSNINMVLAAVLAVVVFIGGPTLLILNLVPTSIGTYFDQLSVMAARTGSQGEEVATWLSGWTIFYWAWWISWTPFVGMFIARISRGRSIRQFVSGVMLIPSVVSLVWFAIFGGAAMDAERGGAALSEASTEGQLFGLLGTLPLGAILSIVAMILVAIFFVSGADAASIVMGTLSTQGSIEPKKWVTIFWGVVMGAIAILMLLIAPVGEDDAALSGIQNVTIIIAAPFAIVMVLLCVALLKDLRNDPLTRRNQRAGEAVERAVTYGMAKHGEEFYLAVKPGAGDTSIDVSNSESVLIVEEKEPSANGSAPAAEKPTS